jgi:hypothetical protein
MAERQILEPLAKQQPEVRRPAVIVVWQRPPSFVCDPDMAQIGTL